MKSFPSLMMGHDRSFVVQPEAGLGRGAQLDPLVRRLWRRVGDGQDDDPVRSWAALTASTMAQGRSLTPPRGPPVRWSRDTNSG